MPWQNDRDARRQSAATYQDPEYKANRPLAMKRDRWKCQIRTPGICIGAASQCDHIVGRASGGSNALANLRAACKPCHAAKTAQEGNANRTRTTHDPPPSPRTRW